MDETHMEGETYSNRRKEEDNFSSKVFFPYVFDKLETCELPGIVYCPSFHSSWTGGIWIKDDVFYGRVLMLLGYLGIVFVLREGLFICSSKDRRGRKTG